MFLPTKKIVPSSSSIILLYLFSKLAAKVIFFVKFSTILLEVIFFFSTFVFDTYLDV